MKHPFHAIESHCRLISRCIQTASNSSITWLTLATHIFFQLVICIRPKRTDHKCCWEGKNVCSHKSKTLEKSLPHQLYCGSTPLDSITTRNRQDRSGHEVICGKLVCSWWALGFVTREGPDHESVSGIEPAGPSVSGKKKSLKTWLLRNIGFVQILHQESSQCFQDSSSDRGGWHRSMYDECW